MFSSALTSSVSVRPQAGNGGGLTDISSNPSQRRKPAREMTLPVTMKEISRGANETDSIVPQPIAAVASRLGVFGWFSGGSTTSVNSVERPVVGGDECKTQIEKPKTQSQTKVEEAAAQNREEELLGRERQVESREKEVEERKLVIDQKEREVEDRRRELGDRERVGKEGEEAMQKKVEQVEKREKELEDRYRELADSERVNKEGEEEMQRKVEELEKRERELGEQRAEFEKEREKWEEERKIIDSKPITQSEWRGAMETFKQEMNLELSGERKKAEERELALETRVMKKLNEILGQDKDDQSSIKAPGWRKKWDASVKPLALTRKGTSSDFGL